MPARSHHVKYSCVVLRGGRSLGARHWHPVLKMYMMPLTTCRIPVLRLPPPVFGAGISGARVYGSSDKHGAYPRDGRIEPQELTATILHELKRRKLRYGLVTMCVGGGMGAAGVFESLN